MSIYGKNLRNRCVFESSVKKEKVTDSNSGGDDSVDPTVCTV